jgi:hypothetical protein
MRKPGTDENDVRMSDVLCDFCRREWTEDLPMIEGHHGSCICGDCLSKAYRALVLEGASSAPAEFKCPLCLEDSDDRNSLDRGGEPAWASTVDPSVCVCRRCIKLAAGALHKSGDFEWSKPVAGEEGFTTESQRTQRSHRKETD